MIIDELVTDRTQADVNRVSTLTAKWLDGTITNEEKAEWLAGMKGAYNFTDLNRVGRAVEFVGNLLFQGGHHIHVTAKQDWTVADIPTQAQMNAFLTDLTLLKSSVRGITIPVPQNMDNLNFQTANQIEQLIIAVYDAINYEGANWTRCGITMSGVEGGL